MVYVRRVDVSRRSLTVGCRQPVTSTVIVAELATCCSGWFPPLLLLIVIVLVVFMPLAGARCQAEDNDVTLPGSNSSSVFSNPSSMTENDHALIAFLVNYTKAASRRRTATDLCSLFKALKWTVDKISSRSVCETTMHVEYVLKTMHKACSAEQGDAREAVECFEKEVSNILWRSCQRRLLFNVNQHSQPYCYFVQEAADCKMALVTSSCGADAGKLAHHVTALTTSSSLATCAIRPLTNDYTGFSYDANCPSYFVDDLELCAIKHLYSQRGMVFRTDNDLVAMTTDAVAITDACRTYREYKLCVRPINKACRQGVRLIYEQQTAIRLYRLKMDFICAKSNRQQYIDRLGCYEKVLESADVVSSPSLRHCDRYWERIVRPSLRRVTAHKFYCDATANVTISVRRKLGRLTKCYERVLKDGCGTAAGRFLVSFMRRAFTDPHYQRYRFRPDCRLHGRRPPEHLSSPSPIIYDDDPSCRGRSAGHNPSTAFVVVFVILVATSLHDHKPMHLRVYTNE